MIENDGHCDQSFWIALLDSNVEKLQTRLALLEQQVNEYDPEFLMVMIEDLRHQNQSLQVQLENIIDILGSYVEGLNQLECRVAALEGK